jgi:hypothetical protein
MWAGHEQFRMTRSLNEAISENPTALAVSDEAAVIDFRLDLDNGSQ